MNPLLFADLGVHAMNARALAVSLTPAQQQRTIVEGAIVLGCLADAALALFLYSLFLENPK